MELIEGVELSKLCDYSFPKVSSVSEEARNFIKKMLVINPWERATVN